MADPYTAIIGGALDAAGGVLGGIPYLVPTSYDDYNWDRMKELERRAELGSLGLTDEEQSVYFHALNRQAENARTQQADMNAAATQAYATQGAGQFLRAQKHGEELAAKTATDIGMRVQAVDIEREQAQEQELEERLAYQSARDQQKAQAVVSMLLPIIGSAQEYNAQASQTQPRESEVDTRIDDEELDPETLALIESLGGL